MKSLLGSIVDDTVVNAVEVVCADCVVSISAVEVGMVIVRFSVKSEVD